jgi:SAM-dependent methyltransferase
MNMNIRENINDVLLNDTALRQVEPHIYTILKNDASASYDKWGGIYEAVACNRIYNRLVWGYWTSEFQDLCLDALHSGDGWVLDAGCGSLAFSAKAYLAHNSRPVILSDRSLRMLQLAKRRLIELNGNVPDNMIFLHANARQLPLKDKCIHTVSAMNLLHAVEDAEGMTHELERLRTASGSLSITTLVRTNRYADSYLHKLAEGGALTERSLDQLITILTGIGKTGTYCTRGNVVFVNLGRQLDYFSTCGAQDFGS